MGAPARKVESVAKHASVVVTGRTVIATLHGSVDFAAADELFGVIDNVLNEQPDVTGVVFDLIDMRMFWPGVPAKGVAWLRKHEKRVRALAVVTRSRTVLAVSSAASVLLPSVAFISAESRAEAVASVQRAIGPKSRRPATRRAEPST